MESISEFDILKPIDESERLELENKINEQMVELEVKKKYLEELKKRQHAVKEKNNIHSFNNVVEEYPDPNEMLYNFLESLENTANYNNIHHSNKESHEQINDMSFYSEYDHNNNNKNQNVVYTEQPFNHPNSMDNIFMNKSFLLHKKKNSIPNFNFHIDMFNKENKKNVIHIQPKGINFFDKSIQVNLVENNEVSLLDNNICKKKNKINNINNMNNIKKTSLSYNTEEISEGHRKSHDKKKLLMYKIKHTNDSRIHNDDKKKEKKKNDVNKTCEENYNNQNGHNNYIYNKNVTTFNYNDNTLNTYNSTYLKSMNIEKKEEILKSSSFLYFLENSSKIVERFLGEQDLFHCAYTYDNNDMLENTEDVDKLKLINTYYCKKYINGRGITDVRTSNIYNELFLASYGLSECNNCIEPEGYVLLWNVTMKNRPEYVFTSESSVCTSLFNKFHPHLIIGGTYTGNVVLWDIRASQKPIQQTLLTSQGHMHSIYCAEIIGTQNSHNLITADTDGRLCNWSLSMFTYPSNTIDLKKGNREISCTTFAFPEGDINTLYGGTEDGSLFQAQIHGMKVGIINSNSIHKGPITSAQFHPSLEGMNDNNDIILTSSIDWTCQLLSIKNIKNPLIVFDSFEDYIMDIKWNPTHPALFSTCSSNGKIKLWNILYDTESSFFDVSLDNSSTNKLTWSHDGRRLIAADTQGYLTLWNASSEIYQPRFEDLNKFDEYMQTLKAERFADTPPEKQIS
ncbi:putative cytoplasmic dynein intermediate chain [Plasmodium gaboni]|uniref:Putative cytoplasmic dynein intermediate chain n=1 Tax=Plasmodium gaboni TaxID=647221 RepID=A0A151LKT0_9APIC|nr:putative cytoplasmic dynein intermediate chain [Plasmodium gaboni]KYN99583.1 putative cytoplasmic dynein intermediate chain [Plasmodium gaboni]